MIYTSNISSADPSRLHDLKIPQSGYISDLYDSYDLYDLYDLYYLACVVGLEPYNLHDLLLC